MSNAVGGVCLTEQQMLDRAERAYWKKRPTPNSACGSVQGYYRHQQQGALPCGPCREARRLVVAITRRRRAVA